MIKIILVLSLLLISFSITPTGGQTREGSVIVQQLDWIKRWPEFKEQGGTPVRVNPWMLYGGVLLGVIGVLCS